MFDDMSEHLEMLMEEVEESLIPTLVLLLNLLIREIGAVTPLEE